MNSSTVLPNTVPPPGANIWRIGGLAAMIRPDAISMIAAGSGALATASAASAARPSERSGSWSLGVCVPLSAPWSSYLAPQRGCTTSHSGLSVAGWQEPWCAASRDPSRHITDVRDSFSLSVRQVTGFTTPVTDRSRHLQVPSSRIDRERPGQSPRYLGGSARGCRRARTRPRRRSHLSIGLATKDRAHPRWHRPCLSLGDKGASVDHPLRPAGRFGRIGTVARWQPHVECRGCR